MGLEFGLFAREFFFFFFFKFMQTFFFLTGKAHRRFVTKQRGAISIFNGSGKSRKSNGLQRRERVSVDSVAAVAERRGEFTGGLGVAPLKKKN